MGMFSDSLDTIYTILGVEATLGALTEGSVTVIDKSDGVELNPGSPATMQTMVPAAAVKVSSLAAVGLTPEALHGTTITFNGQTWKVHNHLPKPTPEGEAAGEVYLLLRR